MATEEYGSADDYAIVEGICHPPGPDDPNYDGFLIKQNEMERIAKTMVGKPFLSEHGDEGVAGELIEAKFVPDIGLVYKARIDRSTLPGCQLLSKIKSGVATGASMGLSHFEDQNTGKIVWRVVREVSGVKTPDLEGTPFVGVEKDSELRTIKRKHVDGQIEAYRMELENDKLRKIVDEQQAILKPILDEMASTNAGTPAAPAPTPAASDPLKPAEDVDKAIRENFAKMEAEKKKLDEMNRELREKAEKDRKLIEQFYAIKTSELKKRQAEHIANYEGVIDWLATIYGGKEKIPADMMHNIKLGKDDPTLGWGDDFAKAEQNWGVLEIQTQAYKNHRASVTSMEAERKERQEREAKLQEELKKREEEKLALEQHLKRMEQSYKIAPYAAPTPASTAPAALAAPASNTQQISAPSGSSSTSSSSFMSRFISSCETINRVPAEATVEGRSLWLAAPASGRVQGMGQSPLPEHQKLWDALRAEPLPYGKMDVFSHPAYNGRDIPMPTEGVDAEGSILPGTYLLRSPVSPGASAIRV
jgi:hypothetical protein